MAKKPTKQTLKSTETDEIVVATVDLPKTPEQAMDELTELSQELGLYDVEGNPLVKDNTTMPVEDSTEALEQFADETNATVAQEPENDSSIATEPLNATEQLGELLEKVTDENKHEELTPTAVDKLTLKDGQGKPIPTKLVVIQSMNYTDLVSQVLYAGYLGSQLDRSFRILSTVPFRIRVLMPEDQYENFLSKESQVVFDENLTYNKVLVKSYDLYRFWEHIINIGKDGGIVKPRHVAQKRPVYMVPILTRAPMVSAPEHRVGLEKIKYTKAELEGFNLESLKACGSWYDLPLSNSKLKYVKAIIQKQEE